MSETIINGVNVWSCKHYDLENNYCDQSYLGEGGLLKNTKNPKKCEQSPDCYFKQLKRLQEENEKLKEEKEKIEEDAEYFLNGDYCDEKCNSVKNELKYKQALEEIRAKLSNQVAWVGQLTNFEAEIYKKINEVLNDRD